MKRIYSFLLLLSIISVGAYALCGEMQWQCDNNECIDEEYRCDGIPHCRDKSDELMDHCMGWSCPFYAFRCSYGACVPGSAWCNGRTDCADGSDELAIVCGDRGEQLKKWAGTCKDREFQCAYGECIDQSQMCDGTKDCANGIDETLEVCAKTKCSGAAFQCAYGGCIAGSARCNNTKECPDGSDEVYSLCNDLRPTKETTTPLPTVLTTLAPEIDCRIPYDKFYMTFKNLNKNKGVTAGSTVSVNTAVEVGCEVGYVLKGYTRNICNRTGWITQFPKCLKHCNHENLLKDLSTKVTCEYNGETRPCHNIEPGTVAKVQCADGYKRPKNSHPSEWEIKCTDDYKWDQAKMTCEPVCGTVDAEVVLFSRGGKVVNITKIPWHVGIYTNWTNSKGTMKPECGGTIISENLIITAAHCFFDRSIGEFMEMSNFVVIAGKSCLGIDCKDTAHQQVRSIDHIEMHGFNLITNNNHKYDVAVIRLSEGFTYSKWVRPICLEFLRGGETTVNTVNKSRYSYAAWNDLPINIAPNESKPAYQTLDVQTFSYTDCKPLINPVEYELPDDKFCSRPLTEGEKMCPGDSGSGIVEKVDGKYRLVGVINNLPNPSISCTGSTDMVATTNVQYIPDELKIFIEDNLLRRKVELN